MSYILSGHCERHRGHSYLTIRQVDMDRACSAANENPQTKYAIFRPVLALGGLLGLPHFRNSERMSQIEFYPSFLNIFV